MNFYVSSSTAVVLSVTLLVSSFSMAEDFKKVGPAKEDPRVLQLQASLVLESNFRDRLGNLPNYLTQLLILDRLYSPTIADTGKTRLSSILDFSQIAQIEQLVTLAEINLTSELPVDKVKLAKEDIIRLQAGEN